MRWIPGRALLALLVTASLALGAVPAAGAAEPDGGPTGSSAARPLQADALSGGSAAASPGGGTGGAAAVDPAEASDASDAAAASAAATAATGSLPTTAVQVAEAFRIVNDHRRQASRAPLAYNSALSATAQRWADTTASARTPLESPVPFRDVPAGAHRMDQYFGKGEFTGRFAGADAVEAITHYLLDFFPRNGTDQFARDLTHVGIGVSSVATTGPAGPGWETYVTIWFYAYPAGQAVPGTSTDPLQAFVPPWAAPAVSPFRDVSTGQLFYKEMAWLAAHGVSTGWREPDGSRTYRPGQPINRDAMAAFLYRAAGSPAYDPPPVSPFADVSPDQRYYKEMAWLDHRGISTGWREPDGTRTYRALRPIDRDAMAAFLYRAAGSPAYDPPGTSPFRDVSTGQQFYREMAWLARTGVSTGWTERDGTRTYRPWQPIARDAMAAFVYRADPVL
jgi:hypothetical protein